MVTRLEKLKVSAYTIPTDLPEGDGTLDWNETTLVLVEASSGPETGFGYTYADLIRKRYPKIPRRVSGYNLEELLPENGFNVARALCGTESTCVTVLGATLKLIHSPPVRSLVVLGYPDVYSAGDHIMEVLDHRPIGLEGIDDLLIDGMKKKHLHPADLELLPEGKGWLLAEFGGETKEEADSKANAFMAAISKQKNAPVLRLYDAPFTERDIWDIRESGLGASARIPGEPDTWEGWEDSAVPPEKLGDYLRDFSILTKEIRIWLYTLWPLWARSGPHSD